tara:strand:- start:351 stop:917 length:567 start_codon:yes stop_codon:yes gene_type:complete
MKFTANQLKQGQKILIDGEPCSVISHEFHKPGKGQAVVRTKLYNLRTERVWERTFKSGETIGSADISEKSFQFLYKEGKTFIFMNSSTFDQIEIDSTILGSVSDWLDGEEECKILFWNSSVLRVVPPTFVFKDIIDTEPGLKGDTVSNTLKPAKIASGIEIQVPIFINIGDTIKIDTRDGSYVSRNNE